MFYRKDEIRKGIDTANVTDTTMTNDAVTKSGVLERFAL